MLKLVGFFNFWTRSVTSANHFILFFPFIFFFSLVTLSLHFCFGLGFSSGKLVSVVTRWQSSLVGSRRSSAVVARRESSSWVSIRRRRQHSVKSSLSWLVCRRPVLVIVDLQGTNSELDVIIVLQCPCSFRLCSSLNNVVQCLRLGSSVSNY